MDLNVRIEKALPPIVPEAISFETGALRRDLDVLGIVAYEHHGREFSLHDRGALTCFYEDLLLGRALPLTFATTGIHDVDTLTAIALFLHRDLATHPATTSFVYSVDFIHRFGLPALAHVPEDLARFVSVMREYFPEKGLSQRELGSRITTAVGWVRDYIQEERYPTLGAVPDATIRILDIGTNGFVLAETDGSIIDGWVELFRGGYLRGVIIKLGDNDRHQIQVAKKSFFIPLDLDAAGRILNQMETAMGELPEWRSSSDGLWLEGPRDGTLLLVQDIVQVLIRV